MGNASSVVMAALLAAAVELAEPLPDEAAALTDTCEDDAVDALLRLHAALALEAGGQP